MNQHNVRNKPRARRRRMKFSKVLLLSFLIALIMLILTLGVFLLMGLRYTSVPLTDGTSVAFFGWMKNGEMKTGTLYYSGGVTAKYDAEAKMLVYSDKSYYMGDMSGILKHGQGKFTFSNGDTYEGSFSGERHRYIYNR